MWTSKATKHGTSLFNLKYEYVQHSLNYIQHSFSSREFRKWRKNYLCDNSECKLKNMARAKLGGPFSLVSLFLSSEREAKLKISLRSLIKLHFYACDPLFRRLAHLIWRGPFAPNSAWLFSSSDVCSVSTRFSYSYWCDSNEMGRDVKINCAHFDYCMQRVNGLATYISLAHSLEVLRIIFHWKGLQWVGADKNHLRHDMIRWHRRSFTVTCAASILDCRKA